MERIIQYCDSQILTAIIIDVVGYDYEGKPIVKGRTWKGIQNKKFVLEKLKIKAKAQFPNAIHINLYDKITRNYQFRLSLL